MKIGPFLPFREPMLLRNLLKTSACFRNWRGNQNIQARKTNRCAFTLFILIASINWKYPVFDSFQSSRYSFDNTIIYSNTVKNSKADHWLLVTEECFWRHSALTHQLSFDNIRIIYSTCCGGSSRFALWNRLETREVKKINISANLSSFTGFRGGTVFGWQVCIWDLDVSSHFFPSNWLFWSKTSTNLPWTASNQTNLRPYPESFSKDS